MQIVQLHGLDKHLYPLVGPLVMDSRVLKQNNNFPFRTSANFWWFIAVDEDNVLGFIPVEERACDLVINNYFVWDHDSEVLPLLLQKVVVQMGMASGKSLVAIAFKEDVSLFEQLGFVEEKRWVRYIKMRKNNNAKEGNRN